VRVMGYKKKAKAEAKDEFSKVISRGGVTTNF
jgi:hypothetical protein